MTGETEIKSQILKSIQPGSPVERLGYMPKISLTPKVKRDLGPSSGLQAQPLNGHGLMDIYIVTRRPRESLKSAMTRRALL